MFSVEVLELTLSDLARSDISRHKLGSSEIIGADFRTICPKLEVIKL
jgi:hypothetical protein